MKYNTYQFDNGLRVIHLPSNSKVVYCGYQIAAGTRHEEAGEEGLAHFVEHTTFKGTARRNSLQIINALERVGGELNAYTNKEDTTYYAALMKEHLPLAIDLLTDIVFHSTYPAAELEKEKEVICEEIECYHDSPAELIYDDFENLLFANHPLGHNILGTAERVRSFTTDDALRFVHRYYRPDNAVFFIYGDVEFERVVKALERRTGERENEGAGERENVGTGERENVGKATGRRTLFGNAGERGNENRNSQMSDTDLAPSLPRSLTPLKDSLAPLYVSKHTHQGHVMLGTIAYDIHHPLRIPLYLLNNMLGGPGLNARLNLALREKTGLVYTVESTMVSYGDTGLWSVYFGCDHQDVKRCLRIVRRELDKLMKTPISSRQLSAAKQQIKGQIAISCDHRENFALSFGKSFLHYGWERNIEKLYQQIDAVTAEQLQQVAQELFAEERIRTLIYR